MRPPPNNKHGYTAQDVFIQKWTLLGKRAWLHRFTDASDLYGRNNGLVITNCQPADFLCGVSGWMGFVEVKSTKDPAGFKLGLIKQPQSIQMTLCRAAGTPYILAVEHAPSGNWFWISGDFLLSQKGTVKWEDLIPYHWPKERLCPITSI